jgi:cell division protein ZapA (FtsZ GTPase activity inhibitor)
MTNTEPNKQPDWKRLFNSAMLELDLASVPKKIEEAKAAISRRASKLQTQEVSEEQLAMMDALNALNDLARMVEREQQDHRNQQ